MIKEDGPRWWGSHLPILLPLTLFPFTQVSFASWAMASAREVLFTAMRVLETR